MLTTIDSFRVPDSSIQSSHVLVPSIETAAYNLMIDQPYLANSIKCLSISPLDLAFVLG